MKLQNILIQITSPFTSIHSRDFWLLWTATLATSLGFWMEQIVMSWFILQLSDSPFILGLAHALRMAPFFIFGILAGSIADKLDRRLLIRLVVGIKLIVSVGLGTLAALDLASTNAVILIGVIYGTANAFLLTIRPAYIHDIVGPTQVINGISVNQIAWRVMGLPGALFGGAAILWIGMEGAFYLMSISYALALFFLMYLKTTSHSDSSNRTTVWGNFVEGLTLIRTNSKVLHLLLIVMTAEVLAFSHVSVLPIFADDVLNVGSGGFGILSAARASGSILGVLLLAIAGEGISKGKTLLTSVVIYSLALICFSFSTMFLLSLFIFLIVGIAAAIFDALQQVLLQLNVDDKQRGMAMGIWVLGVGVGPLGHLEVGILAEYLGAPSALAINGSLLLVFFLFALFSMPKIKLL